MIQYFEKRIEQEMIDHAIEEYPNESCGVIYNGEYIPCENIADVKRWNFQIDPRMILNWRIKGDLQCIVHSHADEYVKHQGQTVVADYGHASKEDMQRQESQKIPYGIVHLNTEGQFIKTFYFGDQLPVQDLLRRPFIHGIYDCYGLLRDFFKVEFNTTIKQFPREFGWWNDPRNSSMLMDYAEEANFYQTQIDDQNPYRKGDAIFMTIRANMVNHVAIYLKDGLIMHHLAERLSERHPLNVFRDNISTVVRYKGLNDA